MLLSSGGHVNPAVTLGVVIAGGCDWLVGIFYVIFQLAGSVVGTVFAWVGFTFPALISKRYL